MHTESNESYLKTELCLIVKAFATTLDQTTFKSLQLGETNVAHGLSVDFKVALIRVPALSVFPSFYTWEGKLFITGMY